MLQIIYVERYLFTYIITYIIFMYLYYLFHIKKLEYR